MSEPMEEKRHPMKHSVTFAGSTLVTMGLVDVLAHLGPTGLLVGGLASYVAWKHGPELYEYVREKLPSPTSSEQSEQEDERPPKRGRSLLDRAIGRFPDDYGEEDQAQPREATAQEGKDTKDALQKEVQASIPPQFRLDDVLDLIDEVNTDGCVYFGQSPRNTIAIALGEMYHVFDVSSSGKGKSNRFRLALMQMVGHCETYFINPLANNVKAVNDGRVIEVWKPIFDRLANKQPMKSRAEILHLMTALVNEIKARSEQEGAGDFSWQQKPIFVFIDELPEVYARCPEAVELLDQIGRTGRQFCVFSWVASQTAAVSEIGQSTAAQANYKTRIYGGGDRNSSGRMMKGSIPMSAEVTLQSQGAGLTLMLADGFSHLQFVRAPLVTNEALFKYFRLPPFRMKDWLASTEKVTERLPTLQLEDEEDGLSPFHLSPEKQPAQAQKSPLDDGGRVKGERGKRVKGPNEEAILDAMEALENEDKPLTMNAIAKKARLTWHHYDEIEEIAISYGYDLDRGKGRPPRTDSEKEV